MAAVSNKKGVVGSKGRNMPIMPSMSDIVPITVYSAFMDANIDQKNEKMLCPFYIILFLWCIFVLCNTEVTSGVNSFLFIIECYVYSN